MMITQTIHKCEAKRSPLVRIIWTYHLDLHVTIGFIPSVEESDIRPIALGMTLVSQTAPFMANGEEIKLYGNAIVVRVEPYQQFLSMHKKMQKKLMEGSNQRYQFQEKGRFDPHLTLGRIQNLHAVNTHHQHQLLALIQEQFKNCSFLVQQAALMRRVSERVTPIYQTIQLYPLQG